MWYWHGLTDTFSRSELFSARVERVGAEGDGIGRLPDGRPFYLPLTLPGELVRARPLARRGDGVAAGLDAVLEPDAARVPPPCPHFGACGGCALQHWRAEDYLAWKTGLLREALVRAGYADAVIAPIHCTQPYQRRRMDFAVQRARGGVAIGLHARGGPVVDLAACHVLEPALFGLVAPLRRLLAGLRGLRRAGSVIANLVENGADLLLRTDAEPTPRDRAALVAFARAQKLPRLCWALDGDDPEPVLIQQPPAITLSGITLHPPPGAFLQASAAGEAAIVAAVLAGLPEPLPARARIAELHAGCGTLSFALVRQARVAAFEGDAAAVTALRSAANAGGLAGRIAVAQRDLARQPLGARELAGFAAVVLDPPHAGAAAQIAPIAAAQPARVVYVSCNPAALARDARALCEAGYRLLAATPIDQFLWSARLESVCVFER